MQGKKENKSTVKKSAKNWFFSFYQLTFDLILTWLTKPKLSVRTRGREHSEKKFKICCHQLSAANISFHQLPFDLILMWLIKPKLSVRTRGRECSRGKIQNHVSSAVSSWHKFSSAVILPNFDLTDKTKVVS